MHFKHPPVNSENPMSETNDRNFIRNEEYTNQLPSAPRIVIPPMYYQQPTTPPIRIGKVVPNPDPKVNIEFLNTVDCTLPLTTLPPTWDYSGRRKAQEVLSFLHLGPMAAAKDKTYLQEAGITMVVGVQPKSVFGAKLLSGAYNAADELGIEHTSIPADGLGDIIGVLPRATQLINTHLASMHHRVQFAATMSREGKVLVFCESGNDKSAWVVAAYLMETFDDIDVVKAVQMCCHRRFCCTFSEDVTQMLSTYHGIVKAKRAAQAFLPQLPSGSGRSFLSAEKTKRRRSRDEQDEMDVDGEEDDDRERFRGRSTTPFV